MALQHLRSNTANKRPDPTAMADGQLAINTPAVSPGLFFKDAAGVLVKVGPVHVGTTAPNASPASGGTAGNSVGEQWLDTTGGTYVFKVWDGSAWRSESGTFVDVNGDTMTGALGIIAGSAAVPGLYFSGDTNTGIYSPGADQVAISTSGAQRLVVDASGNIGVGTSPSQRFHVIGGASTNPSILLAETGGSSLQIVSGASDSFIGTNGATPLRLGTGFTERLRITSAGLVGVGTSSPVATNHIRGSGTSGQVTASWLLENFSSGTAGMDITGAAGSSIWRFLYGGGPSTGTNALTPALTIGVEGAAAGRVGIGTSVPKALLNLVGGPVLTQNIPYAINQDAAYLIAGTTGYTGATTSIDTYGLQHRFKVNSAGVSRVTVDRENGELFSINDQGRVGIGSTAPQHKLQVSSGSLCVDGFSDSANAYISLREGFSPSSVGGVGFRAIDHIDGNADGLGCYGQDGISFYTFANERARIDSSGRLLVGTSSAANGPIYALDTGNGRDISGELSATNQFGFRFVTYKARGSAGSRSIVSNNDELGSYVCFGYDGSSFLAGAQIQAFVDGTPSANDMPSRLVFSTTKDGSASPTLRTLINNQGSHYVVSETTGLFVITTLAAGTANYLYLGYSDGVAGNISSGTYQYGVFTNGNVVNTNGSYTAISDVKLKENIVNASSQWDDLKAIQIRNWNFKEETGHETHRQIGPIAQELEAICPGLVFETLDRDEKGNKTGEVTKGVNQSVLYMKAVKALQEAMERIETLEQRLNDAGIN